MSSTFAVHAMGDVLNVQHHALALQTDCIATGLGPLGEAARLACVLGCAFDKLEQCMKSLERWTLCLRAWAVL